MWLLRFLLLPTVLTFGYEFLKGDYRVTLYNNVLEKIAKTNESASNYLDLSEQSITGIGKNAFDEVTDLRSLNLAKNIIRSLEDKVFAKLEKLEYLSLSDNVLREVGVYNSPYANLRNLKTLDLSRNTDLRDIRRHMFAGLSGSCEIITKGIPLREINGLSFKPDTYIDADPEYPNDPIEITFGQHTGSLSGAVRPPISFVQGLRVKVCIDNGIVNSLDVVTPGEILASDCEDVTVVPEGWELHIRYKGITGFARGWYRLQNLSVLNIDFSSNNITRITPELLNDLPSSVRVVVLENNHIERVENGVMDNPYLRGLVLRKNDISLVDNGAFERLSTIENIFLDFNSLSKIDWVATLPATIRQLYLSNNLITEIPADVFSRFNRLFNVELHSNNIGKLESRSLVGLTALENLRLNNNSLTSIQSGVSQDLKSLLLFDVSSNKLTKLESGIFDGLEKIKAIDLRFNYLRELARGSFAGLPNTLQYIWLDHNEIERLEESTFKSNGQVRKIRLNDNKIKEIARGAFDLPELQILNLANNLLSEFNGDSFQGLPKLINLYLGNNRIERVIEAGKHLSGLGRILDLSNNLFTRLDNNSLKGVMVTRWLDIHVLNTPIEVIHSGIFGEP